MRIAIGTPFTVRIVAALLVAAVSVAATGADAKPHKQRQTQSSKASKATASKSSTSKSTAARSDDDRASGWRTGTAAIVVDGNTGRVLYEDDADAIRHPASLTKIMTLYMLFEQLETGRLRLDSELPVSAHAAAQSPSKLNLRPGSTIDVEDAIKAVVTRSANDVAVVIAEAIGGTESNFAEMMTRKARALGMNNTSYRNASGLPNPGQLTTARDLSILGRAIQDRFPREYRYFATRSFVYRGETIATHNRLMLRMDGVDGIKTGYTGASGFNLVTSVHRDNRFVVGVVLGGSSASSRDARMANLLSDGLPRAYAGIRTAPKIVEASASQPAAIPSPLPAERPVETAIAPLPQPQRIAYASADPVTTAAIPSSRAPAQVAGSAEPIKPVAVKTVTIQRPVNNPAAAQTFTPPAGLYPSGAVQGGGEQVGNIPDSDIQPPAPAMPQAAMAVAAPQIPPTQVSAQPAVMPAPARTPAPMTLGAQAAALAAPAAHRPPPAPAAVKVASAAPMAPQAAPPSPARPGWIIQIGAFGAEKEARARLDVAKAKAGRVLSKADSYTEKVEKGSSDIYRARFAGLSEKDAKEACRLLQRNDFACMTLRN